MAHRDSVCRRATPYSSDLHLRKKAISSRPLERDADRFPEVLDGECDFLSNTGGSLRTLSNYHMVAFKVESPGEGLEW